MYRRILGRLVFKVFVFVPRIGAGGMYGVGSFPCAATLPWLSVGRVCVESCESSSIRSGIPSQLSRGVVAANCWWSCWVSAMVSSVDSWVFGVVSATDVGPGVSVDAGVICDAVGSILSGGFGTRSLYVIVWFFPLARFCVLCPFPRPAHTTQ